MRSLPATLVALALVASACGDDSTSTTTGTSVPATAPGTTTSGTSPPETSVPQTSDITLPPLEDWIPQISVGDCFDDAFTTDGEFDFSVSPRFVNCDGPHDNEVVALLEAEADGFPGEDALLEAAEDGCALEFEAFVGRGLEDTDLIEFLIWPGESEWEAGVRTIVCAVYGSDVLVGAAASAGLTAPGGTIAALIEDEGIVDIGLVDAETGDVFVNLTDDEAEERFGHPTWTADGTAIVYAAFVDGESDLYFVSSDGTLSGAFATLDAELDSPALRPDDSLDVAFIADFESGDFDIFFLGGDSDEAVRLTDHEDQDSSPDWSPDGTQIIFRGRRDGNSDVYLMDADGSNVQRLTTDPAFEGDPTWTRDGRILFTSDRSGNFDIWIMDADGSNQQNLTNHPAADEYPSPSPDGSIVAFHSDRHGGVHIWLMGIDGSDQSLLTGLGPVGYPAFAPESYSR